MREFAQWLWTQLKNDEPLVWEIPPTHASRYIRLWDVDTALGHVLQAVVQSECYDWAKAIEEKYPILTRDEREILLHNLARWHKQWQKEVTVHE